MSHVFPDREFRFQDDSEEIFDVTCPICLDLCEYPVAVACCNKAFCTDCVERLGSCPACRVTPLRTKGVLPSVSLQLASVAGWCSGCSERMTHAEFRAHVYQECTYVCPSGCGALITRAEHFSHLRKCEKTYQYCSGKSLGCGARFAATDKEFHEEDCKFAYAMIYVNTLCTQAKQIVSLKKELSQKRQDIKMLLSSGDYTGAPAGGIYNPALRRFIMVNIPLDRDDDEDYSDMPPLVEIDQHDHL